jgi:hypothetical protein
MTRSLINHAIRGSITSVFPLTFGEISTLGTANS